MKVDSIIIGDNVFKRPPMLDKSKNFVSKGCKKQVVIYEYTSQEAQTQIDSLFTPREFRLKIGLISCYMKHLTDGEFHGSIEFPINELWAACGAKTKLTSTKKFQEELESLFKKLSNTRVNFHNIHGLKKAKKIIGNSDETLQPFLKESSDSIFLDSNVFLPLMNARLTFGRNSKNGKMVSMVSIRGIPIEAAFMILTDTTRTVELDPYFDSLTLRMKDNVFLIAEFSSIRIKHAIFNKGNSNAHIKEILTSHFYQLVKANSSQLQTKARQDIKAIWNSYQAAGIIKEWHWIQKGSDKFYKLEFTLI